MNGSTKIYLLKTDGSSLEQLQSDDDGAAKVSDNFSGTIYENEDTATSDAARRFETSELKLRWALVTVATQSQSFGDDSNQRTEKAAGTEFPLEKADISTLYFKNTNAGQNGTVRILGVRE